MDSHHLRALSPATAVCPLDALKGSSPVERALASYALARVCLQRPFTAKRTLLFLAQGGVAEALETLLGIEKAQRLAEDVTGTRMACTAVLDVLFDAKDWAGINEHIILLSKRRSQLKQV